ncbi:hypothetical protein IWW50_006907, partial [Coemansia erecta]
MRPTPPAAWGSLPMQPARGVAAHAPSHSPQLRPAATHYAPRPDMHHPPEPDAIGAAQRQFHPQQHRESPGARAQFHGHYASAGYPPPMAAGPPSSAHHYQQHMPPGRPQHPLHGSGPFPPRMQSSAQTLPPMYEPAPMQTPGRRSPFASDPSARSSGDYHEHTLPSLQFQSPPGYRQARTPEDSMRQQHHHHSFGHQHRPWSPHHRAQQHFNPAPPSHAFTSDSRFSPYNRMPDMPRDSRQHAAASGRINMGTSPASEAQSAYPDQAQSRYYQLGPSQHPVHRIPSSTPETPSAGTDHSMRAPPPYGPPLHGGERQLAQPQRQPLLPQRPVVRSPSPASAATSTSS